MAQIDCILNLYKTPSNEILRHRKEFYGLLRKRADQTTTWLNLAQSQMDRCDFPSLISREYLLIDKFVCELTDDERKAIRNIGTWTLVELNEYFVNHHKQQTPSTSTVVVKYEFDDYEYAQNVADIEIANEESSINEIRSEISEMAERDPLAVNSPNDIVNGNSFTSMIVKSEFDCEEYTFSVNDAVAVDKVNDDNTNLTNPQPEEDSKRNKPKNNSTTTRTKGGQFECDQCYKWFSQACSLKRHKQIIHQGIRLHVCEICNKRFSEYSNLKKHKASIHDRIRSNKCDQCDREFLRKSHLKIHKRKVHEEIQQFACQICDKRFNLKHLLKTHFRSHTGEKPFGCDQCDRSFGHLSNLHTHKRTVHHGIRPFVCEICTQRFTLNNSLKRHMRKHQRTRRYDCEECGERFPDASRLYQHLQSHKLIQVDGTSLMTNT